jgi:hypothetical protein
MDTQHKGRHTRKPLFHKDILSPCKFPSKSQSIVGSSTELIDDIKTGVCRYVTLIPLHVYSLATYLHNGVRGGFIVLRSCYQSQTVTEYRSQSRSLCPWVFPFICSRDCHRLNIEHKSFALVCVLYGVILSQFATWFSQDHQEKMSTKIILVCQSYPLS